MPISLGNLMWPINVFFLPLKLPSCHNRNVSSGTTYKYSCGRSCELSAPKSTGTVDGGWWAPHRNAGGWEGGPGAGSCRARHVLSVLQLRPQGPPLALQAPHCSPDTLTLLQVLGRWLPVPRGAGRGVSQEV